MKKQYLLGFAQAALDTLRMTVDAQLQKARDYNEVRNGVALNFGINQDFRTGYVEGTLAGFGL